MLLLSFHRPGRLLMCCCGMLLLLLLPTCTAFSATSFIETPLTDRVLYNFGPASERDTLLYTCHRPGNGVYSTDGGSICTSTAQTQIAWMYDQGVRHALVLLGPDELAEYKDDKSLEQLYTDGGIVPHVQAMGEPDAAQRILDWLQELEQQQQPSCRVAAHCTGGKGRAGRVAAAWVSARYGVSPTEATAEVIRVAEARGINRVGAVDALTHWMGDAALETV